MVLNDIVQRTGVEAGTVVAVITATALVYTKVVRPVFRGLKRLGQMADLFLGDKGAVPPVPSLPEQVRQLKNQLGEHVAEYHARPSTSNGVTQASSRQTPPRRR